MVFAAGSPRAAEDPAFSFILEDSACVDGDLDAVMRTAGSFFFLEEQASTADEMAQPII